MVELRQGLIPVGLEEGQSSWRQLLLVLAIEVQCAEVALLEIGVVLLRQLIGAEIQTGLLLIEYKDHALVAHTPWRKRWQVLCQHLTLLNLSIGYVGTKIRMTLANIRKSFRENHLHKPVQALSCLLAVVCIRISCHQSPVSISSRSFYSYRIYLSIEAYLGSLDGLRWLDNIAIMDRRQ